MESFSRNGAKKSNRVILLRKLGVLARENNEEEILCPAGWTPDIRAFV